MKKLFFIIFVFSQIQFCFAEKIGLCLSGGGAKGAYEMGVYKALEEYGLTKDIKAISGTSVGGLNAVLFSTMPIENAKNIWQNQIFFSTILTPDTHKNELLALEVLKLKQFIAEKREGETGIIEYLISAGSYLYNKQQLFSGAEKFSGLFKREGLENLIETNVPLDNIYNPSTPDVFITVVEKQNGGKLHVFRLQDQPKSQITPILLATSAIPFAFDSVTLYNVVDTKGTRINNHTEFFDGGTDFLNGNNTNVEPLLNSQKVKTIFVVFLQDRSRMKKSSAHKAAEQKLVDACNAKSKASYANLPKIEETIEWKMLENKYSIDPAFERQEIIDIKSTISNSGKKVVFFVPSKDLGNLATGTLNFGSDKLNELIELGYNDAIKVLKENGYSKYRKFLWW